MEGQRNVSEVAQALNLPESTVRYYLKEFNSFFSTIEHNGTRSLSRDDVRLLKYLRYLLKRCQCSVREARGILQREEQFPDPDREKQTVDPPDGVDRTDPIDRLLEGQAALRRRLTAIEQRLEDLDPPDEAGGRNGG